MGRTEKSHGYAKSQKYFFRVPFSGNNPRGSPKIAKIVLPDNLLFALYCDPSNCDFEIAEKFRASILALNVNLCVGLQCLMLSSQYPISYSPTDQN